MPDPEIPGDVRTSPGTATPVNGGSRPTCATCRFVDVLVDPANVGARNLVCRRLPQRSQGVMMQAGKMGQVINLTTWPAVKPEEWCGEHASRA